MRREILAVAYPIQIHSMAKQFVGDRDIRRDVEICLELILREMLMDMTDISTELSNWVSDTSNGTYQQNMTSLAAYEQLLMDHCRSVMNTPKNKLITDKIKYGETQYTHYDIEVEVENGHTVLIYIGVVQ